MTNLKLIILMSIVLLSFVETMYWVAMPNYIAALFSSAIFFILLLVLYVENIITKKDINNEIN